MPDLPSKSSGGSNSRPESFNLGLSTQLQTPVIPVVDPGPMFTPPPPVVSDTPTQPSSQRVIPSQPQHIPVNRQIAFSPSHTVPAPPHGPNHTPSNPQSPFHPQQEASTSFAVNTPTDPQAPPILYPNPPNDLVPHFLEVTPGLDNSRHNTAPQPQLSAGLLHPPTSSRLSRLPPYPITSSRQPPPPTPVTARLPPAPTTPAQPQVHMTASVPPVPTQQQQQFLHHNHNNSHNNSNIGTSVNLSQNNQSNPQISPSTQPPSLPVLLNSQLLPLPNTQQPQLPPRLIPHHLILPVAPSHAVPLLTAPSRIICTCRKSRCGKMYCPCLKAGLPCLPECECKNCTNHQMSAQNLRNNIAQQSEPAHAAEDTPAPRAVVGQAQPAHLSDPDFTRPEAAVPCKCTQSSCRKLYCQCYAAGFRCSSRCVCHDCANKHNDPPQRNVRQKKGLKGVPTHPPMVQLHHLDDIDVTAQNGLAQVAGGAHNDDIHQHGSHCNHSHELINISNDAITTTTTSSPQPIAQKHETTITMTTTLTPDPNSFPQRSSIPPSSAVAPPALPSTSSTSSTTSSPSAPELPMRTRSVRATTTAMTAAVAAAQAALPPRTTKRVSQPFPPRTQQDIEFDLLMQQTNPSYVSPYAHGEEPPPQEKRRRGRPRKHPLPENHIQASQQATQISQPRPHTPIILPPLSTTHSGQGATATAAPSVSILTMNANSLGTANSGHNGGINGLINNNLSNFIAGNPNQQIGGVQKPQVNIASVLLATNGSGAAPKTATVPQVPFRPPPQTEQRYSTNGQLPPHAPQFQQQLYPQQAQFYPQQQQQQQQPQQQIHGRLTTLADPPMPTNSTGSVNSYSDQQYPSLQQPPTTPTVPLHQRLSSIPQPPNLPISGLGDTRRPTTQNDAGSNDFQMQLKGRVSALFSGPPHQPSTTGRLIPISYQHHLTQTPVTIQPQPHRQEGGVTPDIEHVVKHQRPNQLAGDDANRIVQLPPPRNKHH